MSSGFLIHGRFQGHQSQPGSVAWLLQKNKSKVNEGFGVRVKFHKELFIF